ncbi:MAG: hypothetical protein ABSF28_06500 [Terracidiphilus sp.]|jgi:hypothetical protein
MDSRMDETLVAVVGKVFVNPLTNEPYGPMRIEPSQTWFQNLDGVKFPILAEDSCGNFFTKDDAGSIFFWDHETDDLVLLAGSVQDFLAHCVDDLPIELPPHEVKSVWVNPAFAKSHGIQAPPDGWIKKPSKPKRNWLETIAFWRNKDDH